MSITSRARDALKFPDRTETSREAVAARFRLREVEAERTAAERPYGGVAHAGRALFARAPWAGGAHPAACGAGCARILARKRRRAYDCFANHIISFQLNSQIFYIKYYILYYTNICTRAVPIYTFGARNKVLCYIKMIRIVFFECFVTGRTNRQVV